MIIFQTTIFTLPRLNYGLLLHELYMAALYRVYQEKCPKWKISFLFAILQNLGIFCVSGGSSDFSGIPRTIFV